MEEKAQKDLVTIMKYITSHDLREDIFSLFIKGPDPEQDFMWTPPVWWLENQAKGLKIVNEKVLELGWDSSGYGFMMRLIQEEVKKTFNYNDDKKINDPQAGDGEKRFMSTIIDKITQLWTVENVENPEETKFDFDDKDNFIIDKGIEFNIKNEPETLTEVIHDKIKEDNDDGQGLAQAYQKTGFGKAMDENNKKALDVAANKGWNEAANHMMASAGGDYGRMRSMFG
jgi:hypothetical protein